MTQSKLVLPVRQGYDLWAPHYDRKGNAAVALKQREIGRLMGNVHGRRVADLGCGTGANAVAMAAAGAEVTAVDFSQGMLAQARQKPGAGRVRFIEHDIERPLPLETDAFDKVLCALALEHVAKLDGVFAEMARVCRPGGEVVVVEMHPAMFLKDVSAHFHDPATGREIRPRSIAHQLSDLVMGGVRAGLRVVEIGEFFADGKHAGWPLLAAMRFKHAAAGAV